MTKRQDFSSRMNKNTNLRSIPCTSDSLSTNSFLFIDCSKDYFNEFCGLLKTTSIAHKDQHVVERERENEKKDRKKNQVGYLEVYIYMFEWNKRYTIVQ